MRAIDPETSELVIIDFQERLMPAIHNGTKRMENAKRLVTAARLLGLRITATEQYPAGLGHTVLDLRQPAEDTYEKITFDACKNPEIAERLDGKNTLVVVGSEAHVCVLQTVLGALDKGRKVVVVADAIGSRTKQNRRLGIDRMRAHGAEIVSTEMVLFEWLITAKHPNFKAISALIK